MIFISQTPDNPAHLQCCGEGWIALDSKHRLWIFPTVCGLLLYAGIVRPKQLPNIFNYP